MRNLDGKVWKLFGNSKLWNAKVVKNLCWPNGNSDLQEGVNQSMKSDSLKKGKPTERKNIFLYFSILILYMFRETNCSSSRDWIISIGIGVYKYKKKNCVSCWLFTKIVIRCTVNKIYKVFNHIAFLTQIPYLLYYEIKNILNNLLKSLLACGNVSVLSFRRYNLATKMIF